MSYAEQYTDAVLNGDIIAGKKIIQACERFKNDLKRQRTENFPYYFDEEIETKVIKFVEMLPTTDGKRLHLAMFQKWILSNIYSWREVDTGNKRFDRAFISMARKNSKTYIASTMGAIALLMEKEPQQGRQVLFTANAYKQARLAYDMMASELRQVVKASPYIRQRLKIGKMQITDKDSNSFATALSSDTTTLDGYGAQLAICDEYHLSKTTKVLEALKTGMIKNENATLVIISTSGDDTNVPMYSEYQFVSKVLEGKEHADRYFIAIWEIDQEDKETLLDHPEVWIKANPLFEIEGVRKTMTSTIRDDLQLAIKQENVAGVLVKNFNTWQNAKTNQFLNIEDWQNTLVTDKPDIKGNPVYIGIDLSKTNDLSAVSWLVPLSGGKFYADSFSFVGTKGGLDRKERRDNISYTRLQDRGECDITTLDSGVIDYSKIYDFVNNLIDNNDLDLQAICYDPYNMNTLLTDFEKQGYPMIEVRQGAITLSVPIREFREAIYNRDIIHGDNQLLEYAVNNSVIRYDSQNNALLDKTHYETRIDPVAALLDAWTVGKSYFKDIEGSKADNDFYSSDNFSF